MGLCCEKEMDADAVRGQSRQKYLEMIKAEKEKAIFPEESKGKSGLVRMEAQTEVRIVEVTQARTIGSPIYWDCWVT